MVQLPNYNFDYKTLQQIIFQLPFTIEFTNKNITSGQGKMKA